MPLRRMGVDVLNPDIRRRQVLRLTPRPLYPGIHRLGGWVGGSVGLDVSPLLIRLSPANTSLPFPLKSLSFHYVSPLPLRPFPPTMSHPFHYVSPLLIRLSPATTSLLFHYVSPPSTQVSFLPLRLSPATTYLPCHYVPPLTLRLSPSTSSLPCHHVSPLPLSLSPATTSLPVTTSRPR